MTRECVRASGRHRPPLFTSQVCEHSQTQQPPGDFPKPSRQAEREAVNRVQAQGAEDCVETPLLHSHAPGHEEKRSLHEDHENGDRKRDPDGHRCAEQSEYQKDFDDRDQPSDEKEKQRKEELPGPLPNSAENLAIDILPQTSGGPELDEGAAQTVEQSARRLGVAGSRMGESDK